MVTHIVESLFILSAWLYITSVNSCLAKFLSDMLFLLMLPLMIVSFLPFEISTVYSSMTRIPAVFVVF